MDKKMYEYYLGGTEEKHWWHRARRKIIGALMKKHISLSPRAKILDVGCGTGVEMDFLKKYGEVWGIDSEKQMIEACASRGLKNATVSTIEEFDAPDNSFDLITCLDCLEHIEDEDKALSKMHRLGKNGSYFIGTFPAGKILWSEFDVKNHHFRRYNKKHLAELLKRHGFKIIKLSYYNTFLSPPIAVLKMLSRVIALPAGSEHALKIPHPIINGTLESIFQSEKHLLTRMNFPFGISLIVVALNNKQHA